MKHVIDLLNQYPKNLKDKPIILAVSGGVDSMVLCHLLVTNHYHIHVLHFNHQKREQSHIEAKLVEKFCGEYHIPFHYIKLDIAHDGNFHHQAHILRHHHLIQLAKQEKTPYMMTAHHADDLLESILIKLTRGSNLLGYAGMQYSYTKHNMTIIKPLLYTSKQEIINYANTHKIAYMNDASNEENTYLRNRYRHAISPIMKQENPKLLDQIIKYHEQLTDAFQFIRKQSISFISHHQIDLASYRQLDTVLQNDIIAYLLEQKDIEINYEKIQAIRSMLINQAPNQSYRLNHKYICVKAYNHAFIEPLSPVKPVFIEVKKGENVLPNMKIFTFLNETPINTEEFTKLCYNKLAFPLWLRHRLDGDKLAYNYGHKKLKKLLIDKKIPMKKRDQLWVLTDNNNQILWVENYYLNQTLGQDYTLYFKSKGE